MERAVAPFFRSDLPNFRRQPAGNVITVFPGNDAHALLFRYAPRPAVRNSFGNTQQRKFEGVKPIVGHRFTSLGHQTLSLPWQTQPESAIIGFTAEQADSADQLARGAFQAKRPRPFVATRDGGQCDITVKLVSAIGWIRPGHGVSDVADNLPM